MEGRTIINEGAEATAPKRVENDKELVHRGPHCLRLRRGRVRVVLAFGVPAEVAL